MFNLTRKIIMEKLQNVINDHVEDALNGRLKDLNDHTLIINIDMRQFSKSVLDMDWEEVFNRINANQ